MRYNKTYAKRWTMRRRKERNRVITILGVAIILTAVISVF